jgi:hypothetical protein
MSDGRTIAFGELATSGGLVGVIRAVSKLAVPDDEWRDLWGDAG